jgi:hypothetical protein
MNLPFGLTGIKGFLIAGLAVLALVAVIVMGVKGCKEIDQENYNTTVNSGVIKEREASKGVVINHVEQANDAVRNPSPAELNSVCHKYDRNCKNSK